MHKTRNARRHIQKPTASRRGAMLVVVILSLFLITALTVAVLTVTTNALYTNRQQQDRVAALNVAESGAEWGALWLRNQATPPSGTADIKPPIGVAPMGSYDVAIRPHPDNPSQFLKLYHIVCTGTVGSQSKTVEIVVRQASFGKYAYFTDAETTPGGGAIWWNAKDKIDGPIHSNNSNGSNFNIDYSGWSSNTPTRPIFLDQVTGSGSTINYTPRRPRSESEFRKVFMNGSKGFKLGMPKINLPPSTDAQKTAAWGSITGFPGTNGVYLRADYDGGVYIRGDASIAMSVNASGDQVMTVKQGTNTTLLTFDKFTGGITTSGPMGQGSPTSAPSLSNGVIYCTGNITSLSGTIADNKVVNGEVSQRSSFTIATDTLAGKDITITGDLVYKTKPDKTKDPTAQENLAAGTLGLVARNINIADDGTSKHNHPDREIDAVMIAGGATTSGSISVNNYSMGSTGTLKVVGGLIQSTRGIVAQLSNGVVSHGYAKDYNYDSRLASSPPPFYPTTGQYDRISWRVLPNAQ